VQISFFTVRHDEKLGALLYILRELVAPRQQSIIFAATRCAARVRRPFP
jgi:hypothetical protein